MSSRDTIPAPFPSMNGVHAQEVQNVGRRENQRIDSTALPEIVQPIVDIPHRTVDQMCRHGARTGWSLAGESIR